MARLFGIDIAAEVARAIASAGNLQQGTLTKGLGADATGHTFQGFLEVKEVRLPDTVVTEARPVLTILGASVSPAAVPAVNDAASFAGVDYELVGLVARDPAEAVYEFEVR